MPVGDRQSSSFIIADVIFFHLCVLGMETPLLIFSTLIFVEFQRYLLLCFCEIFTDNFTCYFWWLNHILTHLSLNKYKIKLIPLILFVLIFHNNFIIIFVTDSHNSKFKIQVALLFWLKYFMFFILFNSINKLYWVNYYNKHELLPIYLVLGTHMIFVVFNENLDQ